MNFLEKDLEEIIYLSDNKSLLNKGLFITGKLKRQLIIGKFGISDLVSITKPTYDLKTKRHLKGKISVFELKKENISVSSFFQALGYLRGIIHFLEKRNLDYHFDYEIVLIGKKIDLSSTISFLPSVFKNHDSGNDLDALPITSVVLYTYKYGINGLEFNDCSDASLINKSI